MIYIKLFSVFFKIGIFSFGGGLSMLLLIEKEIERNKWITSKEFLDIVSISQITPGPISINSATYIGLKVGGILGAVVSTLGVSLPSIIVILILSNLIFKLKENKYKKAFFLAIIPITTAMMLYAAIVISRSTFFNFTEFPHSFNFKSIIFSALLYILLYRFKFNPTLLVFTSAIIGIFIF
jgi:chromate transporter